MALRVWLRRGALLAVAAVLAWGGGRSGAEDPGAQRRMRRDINILAADECEGRGLGTRGINRAADYVAAAFKKAGLKPAGAEGSYFQPFPVDGPGKLGEPNHLRLEGPKDQALRLKQGEDFQVMGLSGSGTAKGPVVFAGYGITAPQAHYDDYANVNVAGKVVVLLRRAPRFGARGAPFKEDEMMHFAALTTKVINAELHKAAAVLFVNDHNQGRADRLLTFAYTAQGAGASKLPVLMVRRSVVDAMLRAAGAGALRDLEKAIEADLKPRSLALKGWTADAEATVKREVLPAKNIVGSLDGAGPLAGETVIVGAHYDHLGYGGPGSLARNQGRGQIHHGADDNGSGTTVLMELVRHFGSQTNRQGRRLVFIAFSGEETGLLGSEYYCNHPRFPLSGTVAMVNLDMVGRLHADARTGEDLLEVHGTGTSAHFSEWIDALNKPYHFHLIKQAGGLGPSDHASFYQKKVPVYFFFTGNHKDYHKPSDTADKVNVPGMAKVAALVEDLLTKLATTTERPKYVYVKSRMQLAQGPSGPRLRFMPAYYREGGDSDGVLIGDVIESGPADKGGLKAGDRIVEVAGKPVKNLQAFMVLMRTQKVGKPLEVGFVRAGKKRTTTVVPE